MSVVAVNTLKSHLLILLLLVSTTVYASPPVQIQPDFKKLELGEYLDILEDKKGNLTLSDVRGKSQANNWYRNKEAIPN
jgi:hypothetical protein